MTKPFSKRTRFAVTILAVVAILAVAFAFPQVRAIANDFLGLFRVEKVTLLPVDINNIAFDQSGAQFDQLFTDDVKYEVIGERQEVTSAEEASALAGIPVRLPTYAGLGEMSLNVEAGAHGEFNVDLPRIRAILEEAGYTDIVLPDNLDQTTLIIDMPRSVVASYGDCQARPGNDPSDPDDQAYNSGPQHCVSLIQLASPTVNAPPDLDIQQIGKAFLQLAGMPAHDAEAFSKNIDWATTLVLPIPLDADYSETEIDGVQGFVVREQYSSSSYTAVWVKDGVMYILTGTYGSFYQGRQIADSLK